MKNYFQKLHPYLFYAFVFLLPWHTIYIVREVFFDDEKWQYGTIGIYVADIVLILWILLSIYLYKDTILTHIFKKPKMLLFGLLLSLWSFTSILWADDKTLAFYFAIKLSLALDLFFLIQVIPLKVRKFSIIFIFSILIQSLIGLYQFVTQHTFAQKFLGLQYHDVWHGGNAIMQVSGERWLRAYGGTPHPNIFGVILLCALLLSIFLFFKQRDTFSKIFILASISIFTANILYTFSRTMWLTSIFSLIIFAIYIYRNKKYKIQQLATPLLLIAATTLLITNMSHSLFFNRITQDTTLSHNSISDRTLYITQSKTLITLYPLHGTGIGNYTNTLKSQSQILSPIWQYQPVHNIYLLIISEIGFIGFGLFGLFIIAIFCIIYLNKKNINLAQFTFITLFIGMLFMSLFDHLIWTSHFGLFTLFLLGGLSIKQYKHPQTSQ